VGGVGVVGVVYNVHASLILTLISRTVHFSTRRRAPVSKQPRGSNSAREVLDDRLSVVMEEPNAVLVLGRSRAQIIGSP
jgi:hypothetical protein